MERLNTPKIGKSVRSHHLYPHRGVFLSADTIKMRQLSLYLYLIQTYKDEKTMATVETTYLGGLRTEATHTQSGATILTDAPTDNHGKGEAFSPTDLVAAALGSCMMTLMGISADRHDIKLEGTKLSITKVMSTEAPRRIAEVIVEVRFPQNYSDKERRLLENAAEACPVAKSLHPDCKQSFTYIYPTNA